ncbi:SRPBCC family protein [Geodermatophilus sabuli]|uniref:Carbon monoxide dehydrogenase subunit G n=1 Tax=Geodermatophilus sabuli TaxID=1564158 RepID=A0A285EB75_9ACTN|nr:SRPBCC family protein [Geodermatophilus sabuli]MBB3084373.1 putative membrane protein [Geodermatophilus sabuli]SNX96359.1 Carbon monoxide dehydrogenase subunit G [Geodermatophilus sabuli]
MPVVEHDVVIPSPPDAVFEYLADPGNPPRWDSSIVSVEQVGPGPVTVGTRWRGTSKVMGRRFEWTTEVTEAERPTRLASRSVEGALAFSVSYDLRAEAGGTHLRYRLEAESGLGGAFGRLADPVVQRAQSRAVRAGLRRLAEQLDRSTAT